MIEHSKSIEEHDIKIACLYMQKLAQAILNITKVGPSVREKFKLVIEKLSGRSVLIVLCSGKISGYIGQCPLHFVNDTTFSNKRGHLLYSVDRISHLASLQKHCFLKITF